MLGGLVCSSPARGGLRKATTLAKLGELFFPRTRGPPTYASDEQGFASPSPHAVYPIHSIYSSSSTCSSPRHAGSTVDLGVPSTSAAVLPPTRGGPPPAFKPLMDQGWFFSARTRGLPAHLRFPAHGGLPETGCRTRQRRKSFLAGGGLPTILSAPQQQTLLAEPLPTEADQTTYTSPNPTDSNPTHARLCRPTNMLPART